MARRDHARRALVGDPQAGVDPAVPGLQRAGLRAVPTALRRRRGHEHHGKTSLPAVESSMHLCALYIYFAIVYRKCTGTCD
jgi:hypothetical protein